MNYNNPIGKFIKEERKKAHLTQEQFALRSGLSLSFVRNLEQGKQSLRLDKINQALYMFGAEASPMHFVHQPTHAEKDGYYV